MTPSDRSSTGRPESPQDASADAPFGPPGAARRPDASDEDRARASDAHATPAPAGRTRLFVIRTLLAGFAHDAGLPSAFDVVQVEHLEDVPRGTEGYVLMPAATMATGLADLVAHLAEAVALVERRDPGAEPRLLWSNAALDAFPELIRARFLSECGRALDDLAGGPAPASHRGVFEAAERVFEVIVASSLQAAPAGTAGAAGPQRAIAVLREITAHRRLQTRLDQIDAAGADLLRIDSAMIQRLNSTERLRLLQERIVRVLQDVLHFEHFELRLLDRRVGQLELVFAHGLAPLPIGQSLYAREIGNGICGWVATTGRSYRCADVLNDPRYQEGLENARSSLTVPLRLHEQVIGILNVESVRPNAFTAEDERLAEIFSRYIAMAMHILDLLVVERFTTNEQMAQNVLSEIKKPLAEIAARVDSARKGAIRAWVQAELDRIIQLTDEVRRRVEACVSGAPTLLTAEVEDDPDEIHPALAGKRVLVCDNEETVLTSIRSLLERRGCRVTTLADGLEIIDLLTSDVARSTPFDLVISDIRMPHRNGYEVFRAAKAACSTTPVIFMTGFGYDPHHSIVRANQEGLHSFLFKPIRARAFLDAVIRALGGEAAPST